MDYMFTDFSSDSSSRFLFKALTNRQTDRQTRLNALPTPAAIQPAWVIINWTQQETAECLMLLYNTRKKV